MFLSLDGLLAQNGCVGTRYTTTAVSSWLWLRTNVSSPVQPSPERGDVRTLRQRCRLLPVGIHNRHQSRAWVGDDALRPDHPHPASPNDADTFSGVAWDVWWRKTGRVPAGGMVRDGQACYTTSPSCGSHQQSHPLDYILCWTGCEKKGSLNSGSTHAQTRWCIFVKLGGGGFRGVRQFRTVSMGGRRRGRSFNRREGFPVHSLLRGGYVGPVVYHFTAVAPLEFSVVLCIFSNNSYLFFEGFRFFAWEGYGG